MLSSRVPTYGCVSCCTHSGNKDTQGGIVCVTSGAAATTLDATCCCMRVACAANHNSPTFIHVTMTKLYSRETKGATKELLARLNESACYFVLTQRWLWAASAAIGKNEVETLSWFKVVTVSNNYCVSTTDS